MSRRLACWLAAALTDGSKAETAAFNWQLQNWAHCLEVADICTNVFDAAQGCTAPGGGGIPGVGLAGSGAGFAGLYVQGTGR